MHALRRFMRIVERLDETPVSDLQLHGDFSHAGSFGAPDYRLLSSPKARDKIVRLFRKTPFDFELHFVNQPGYGPTDVKDEYGANDEPMGEISAADAKTIFGIVPKRRDTITFIMGGNNLEAGLAGFNDQMSGWIVAHRFAHALYDHLTQTEKVVQQWLRSLEAFCDIDTSGSLYSSIIALATGLFTMKSARDDRLTDWTEELMAQYLITGSVRFNRAGALNKSREGTVTVTDPAAFDHAVEIFETALPRRFEKVLQSCIGRIFTL